MWQLFFKAMVLAGTLAELFVKFFCQAAIVYVDHCNYLETAANKSLAEVSLHYRAAKENDKQRRF